MKPTRILLTFLFAAFACSSAVPFVVWAEIITDDTPVPAVGAPGGPDRILTPAEEAQWVSGRRIFDRDWEPSNGLGRPDMNADSCRACHLDPVIGGSGGLDVNVFRFGFDDGGLGPFTDLPGGQIASRLRNPQVLGREESNDSADVFETRQAPSILGLGLIDRLPESVITANADPGDTDGDGIRGVARFVSVGGGQTEVGRFGWKSQVPSLEDFLRDAMGEEVGISTDDNGRGFGVFNDADGVADPEIDAGEFADTLFFMQHLAAPARKGSTDPAVTVGEQVFSDIGCADCHIPTLVGMDGPVNLYSDLLLHNVHPTTFRGMAEPDAGVGSYRTPPLWGISSTAPYFHDGSSESLEDAVLRHDGEALDSRLDYESLTINEQQALLRFLEDL